MKNKENHDFTRKTGKLAPFLRKQAWMKGGRQLWLTGLWLVATGCIVPTDIEYKPDEQNIPPKILLDTLVPPTDGLLTLDSSPECSPLEFLVGQVKESNVLDILSVGWFLDWERSEGKEPEGNWQLIFPNEEETREGKDFSLNLELLNPEKVHTLRVFVADRPPRIPDNPDELILEFPSEPDGQYDTYQWTFELKSGEGYCNPGE
jgi:hypothetical protein